MKRQNGGKLKRFLAAGGGGVTHDNFEFNNANQWNRCHLLPTPAILIIMTTEENDEGIVTKLVNATVKFLMEFPTVNVPAAMRAAMFTIEQSRDRAKQMRVRRALTEAKAKQPSGSSSNVDDTDSGPKESIHAGSIAVTSTNADADADAPAVAEKKRRKKSVEAQADRIAKKKKQDTKDKAYSYATGLYATERKKVKGLSAEKVAILTQEKFGMGPCARTITREVNKEGRVNQPAPKVGARGNIPEWAFNSLCTLFELFISINQLNALDFLNNMTSLSILVNNTMRVPSSDSKHPNRWLLRRILEHTGIELFVSKEKKAEERRIKWTTYKNLSMWFDNWAKDLVELGFATWVDDVGGEIDIPPDQLVRILNFDETCLTLDGSSCSRGGRPRVIFYNPHLPQLGSGVVKTSNSATMITGMTDNFTREAIDHMTHEEWLEFKQTIDDTRAVGSSATVQSN